MSLYCTETLAGDTPFSPEIKKRKIDRGVIKFVKGRDGSENPFDISKIENAVQKAFQSEHKTVPQPVISMIAKIVVSKVTNSQVINTVDIEKIQTSIEDTLMDLHYNDVAKHYILYREERAKHRKLYGKELKGVDDIKVPWGPLGYVTFKRTYARRFNEDDPNSSTEEYHDAVKRIVTACHTQLNVGFTVQEERRFAKYLLELKGCVGGRFLWQLGTRTVDKQGMASLQNCCFCTLEKIWDLCWIFDLLMCGAGVGFSVQQKHISKLPPVLDRQVIVKRLDTKDADFIVPDSREGWVRLLKEILTSYFVTGTSFSYSTILIRGKGTPIKGFGGTASGPEELCKRMSQICDLLDKHRGRQLGSVDCLDTVNMIAALVVSGNVRRSALIALGDCWDIDYIKAKWWKLGPEKVPDHRAMSNNSVVCDDVRKLPPEFWEGYTGGAEPYGLINLNLTRKIGRLSDGEKYPDPGVEGFNPCAEQGLDNYETCTLAEVFLPNLTSHDEAIDMIKMLYRVCKHSLLLSFHHKDSEDVVHKNMRMGIGITGYCQASEEQKSWLPGIYEELRRYDIEYSTKLGCPISIKLTTCKPSGTLSLFPNVTPGVHPGIFQYYIRRMRMSSDLALVNICRKNGFKVEYQRSFGKIDPGTSVIEFPCRYPDGTVLAKDVNAIRQMEMVRKVQTDWSDNSVSCTVYYKPEELPEIRKWMEENYTNTIKSISFLLHEGHGFDQAPYEEISRERYEELIANVRPITSGNIQEDMDTSGECAKGFCPIR